MAHSARTQYLRDRSFFDPKESPLASCVLSAKYHSDGKAEGGPVSNEEMKEFLPEEQRATRIISAMNAVSEHVGRSIAQVALAWLRHQTVPIISIIGARKVSQLQDKLASLDLELSAEKLKSLDGAVRLELGFRSVGSLSALSAALHREYCCMCWRLSFRA